MKKIAFFRKSTFVFVLGLSVIASSITVLSSIDAAAQVRPAYTKNVDEPGRTPWETRSQFLPNAGGCYGTSDCYNYQDGTTFAVFDLRPVPAGKRWIVRSVSGGFNFANDRITNIELSNGRGFLTFDYMKWTYGGPFQQAVSYNAQIFSTEIWTIFGPGETPTVRVSGSPSLNGYSVLIFSGYLIDATN